MLSENTLNVMVRGIQVKLNRGEELEDVLATYVKLDDAEKNQIRERFK